MIKITVKELENNIDKYICLGLKEEIEVTKKGRVIFRFVPEDDVIDIKGFDKAYAEYLKNPKTYTFEEVAKELGLDDEEDA